MKSIFTCVRSWAIYVLLFPLVLISCKDGASVSSDIKKDQDQALRDLNQSFEKLKTDHAEVVDFRILQESMPEKLLGMPRTAYDGQKSGIAGLNISTASAEYREDQRSVSISITDTGGFGSAIAGLANWSQIEVDKETQDGYERTTTIGGKKAIEKFNRTTSEGEIAMIAADRFIVTVKGTGISEGDLRTAVEKISVKN